MPLLGGFGCIGRCGTGWPWPRGSGLLPCFLTIFTGPMPRVLLFLPGPSLVMRPFCSWSPHGVRDVLRRRLARLPDVTVELLRLAAVVGRDSDVGVLVATAGGDEDETLDAIEAAVIAGLLVEPAPGRVRFAHALVRDTLLADVSGVRRSRMHARVAGALEGTGDVAALAYHYAHAASPEAVHYCVLAAEVAERRYAHDVA